MTTKPERKTKSFLLRHGPLLVVLLCIGVFFFIRYRLAGVALERDEGEYAYAGQLILQGVAPYKFAYNMKLPGTYGVYAMLMAICGESAEGIHIGLAVVNAVSALLLFFLSKRSFGIWPAVVAAAMFCLLSANPFMLGLAAHANHFVILFALASLLVSVWAIESKKLLGFFLAGLLAGVAFLVKQQGAAFGIFAFGWILWSLTRVRPVSWAIICKSLVSFSIGAIMPFGLTCLVLWRAGVFETFWFWTFSYAKTYAGREPIANLWRNLSDGIEVSIAPTAILWILAFVGLIRAVVLFRRLQSLFILGFTFASIVSFSAGFYFRQHYFLLLVPAVAWGLALFVKPFEGSRKLVVRFGAVGLVLGSWCWVFYQNSYLFFKAEIEEFNAIVYGNNPFLEAKEIASYIRNNSGPTAKLAVVGSEPEIYFYARRHSATGYIYTYPLMENQPFSSRMQKEMVREIEEAEPEFFILIGFPYSWLMGPSSDRYIFRWVDEFSSRFYTLVGIVDTFPDGTRKYRWGADAVGQIPLSDKYILVFRRR